MWVWPEDVGVYILFPPNPISTDIVLKVGEGAMYNMLFEGVGNIKNMNVANTRHLPT